MVVKAWPKCAWFLGHALTYNTPSSQVYRHLIISGSAFCKSMISIHVGMPEQALHGMVSSRFGIGYGR